MIIEDLNSPFGYELPQPSEESKKRIEVIKTFIANGAGKFRTAYSNRPESFQRHCVLFFSSNEPLNYKP